MAPAQTVMVQQPMLVLLAVSCQCAMRIVQVLPLYGPPLSPEPWVGFSAAQKFSGSIVYACAHCSFIEGNVLGNAVHLHFNNPKHADVGQQ